MDIPHQEEFEKVKKRPMETTTIATWDKNLPLRLYADAAKTGGGLGYVLTQPEGEREHIIYCGSTGLTDAQRRWSMCELELGSIVAVAAVQTRSTSVKIARDLIDMAARAIEDEDYQELVKKIERGVEFDKLGKEDPHRKYAEKWSNPRILKTTGGNFVYMDNLLVPPESERPDLIARSHQSHMNFKTIYATQRKHWWWPELKKEIREEWEKCEDCLVQEVQDTSPPFIPTRCHSIRNRGISVY